MNSVNENVQSRTKLPRLSTFQRRMMRVVGKLQEPTRYLVTDGAVGVAVLRHLCILEVGQGCRYVCHWSNCREIPFQGKQSLLGF